LFASAVLLCACGGGEKRDLTFEIAAEIAPDSMACEGSLADQLAPCTSVQVFRVDEEGRRVPVQLFRLETEDGAEPVGAYKLRFESRDIGFDADGLSPEETVDLEIRVFGDDGRPLYGASLEDVRLSAAEPLRVRLYPFRRWACPGPLGGGGSPEPRALHAAVPLPDGDVLIFGGVTGTDVDPASVRERARVGALLQRSIELYDASSHRFERVSGEGPDGQPGFGRVLFGHRYVGAEMGPEGNLRHRIRIVGGWTLPPASAGTTALRFDNTGTLGGPFGSPVAPSDEVEVGDPVDLLFDPEALTVTFEDATSGVVPRGAAVRMSPFLGPGEPDDTSLVLVGLGPSGADWVPSPQFYLAERGGETRPVRDLITPRLGATVRPLPEALGGFLIWGGNAGHEAGTLAATAGEIQLEDETGGGTAVAAVDGLPPATAFHTMTRLGRDDLFLVAGGYRVADDGFIYFDPSPTPLSALQITDGPTVVARRIEAAGYTPTIFHTATETEDLGLVLVGGAHVDAGNRLAPLPQAGAVDGSFAWAPITHRSASGEPTPSPLGVPRWGHTTTALSGHRLLVVGGFGRDEGSDTVNALRALSRAELLYTQAAPAPLLTGQCGEDDLAPPDAGALGPMDAGLPPRLDGGAPATPDAGPPDAGPADGGAGDAGPAADAGLDGG
jgi:hypothetical protein